MSLIVRRPGTSSLIVDGGRPHTLHVGIPRGGPADTASWQLGNSLLGNTDSQMAALEITLLGPILEATARHTLVIYGAAFATQHKKTATRENKTIPPGHLFTVEGGDEVQIQGIEARTGLRAYLCVAGGFIAPKLADSQSGLEPVKEGDVLSCGETASPIRHRWMQEKLWADAPPGNTLRILTGTHLNKKLSEPLLGTKFTIRPESNRMGLRLASNVHWPSDGKELVSAPVVQGTLQLPSGGQPILLGVDAQTIGGYPRLGHVIEADLDCIGQLRPGESVRFAKVTLEEAERLAQSRRQWLRTWLERIRLSI